MLLAQRQTACGVSLAVYLGGLFKSRQHDVAFEDDGACRTGSREHASRRPANSLPSRRERRAGCAHGGRHARPASSPHASTPEATVPKGERRRARWPHWRVEPADASTRFPKVRWSVDFRRRAPIVRG